MAADVALLDSVTEPGMWIPLGALVVSLTTLIMTAMTARGKASNERLAAAEAELAHCQADRAALRDDLFHVMSELMKLKASRTTPKKEGR